MATVKRGEDLSAESDADVIVTAQALCHDLTDEHGGCLFCGHDPYHYVDNGVGMEAVAVTCCEDGAEYYGKENSANERVALRLSRYVGLQFEAAYIIETLIKRLRETMPEAEARTLEDELKGFVDA